MTVTELLDYMQAVYQGCTPEAIKATKSSYYAMLRKHEGEPLQKAWDEVFASFKATRDNRFPIVKDFLAHLVTAGLFSSSGPKLDLEGHRRRKRELIDAWAVSQGATIKSGCGEHVYSQCLHEVRIRADHLAWKPEGPDVFIHLGEAVVTRCQQAVISQFRLSAHGAWALEREDGGQEWARQFDAVAALLAAGSTPPPMATESRQALKPLHVKPKRMPIEEPNPYEGLDE
jgi:hypothetical protein